MAASERESTVAPRPAELIQLALSVVSRVDELDDRHDFEELLQRSLRKLGTVKRRSHEEIRLIDAAADLLLPESSRRDQYVSSPRRPSSVDAHVKSGPLLAHVDPNMYASDDADEPDTRSMRTFGASIRHSEPPRNTSEPWTNDSDSYHRRSTHGAAHSPGGAPAQAAASDPRRTRSTRADSSRRDPPRREPSYPVLPSNRPSTAPGSMPAQELSDLARLHAQIADVEAQYARTWQRIEAEHPRNEELHAEAAEVERFVARMHIGKEV